MNPLRHLTALLFLLVLLASVGNVALAVTRPDPNAGGGRPQLTGIYSPGELAGPGDAPVRVAVEAVRDVLTYDYRHLGRGVRAAAEHMTRSFAAGYRKGFQAAFGRAAVRQRAVTSGDVRGAGLVRVDGDRAVVLVYADQVLVESRGRTPSSDGRVLSHNQLRVALDRRDDAWLVSGIRRL